MKKIFLTIIFAGILFSCDNFLEEEINSNAPVESLVAPEKKLAASIMAVYTTKTNNLNFYGNRMIYAWGLNVNNYTGVPDEFSYNYTSNTNPQIFENLYYNMDDLQAIINYPNPTGNYDKFIAIAKILKADSMQYVVSLYGDAPYSQAFKQDGNTAPKYDDDKAIYRNLFNEFEEAKVLISSASTSAISPGSVDIIFGGVMSKWVSYANTLELKMMLKLSQSTNVDVIALKNDIKVAVQATGTFVTADVTLNPGFSNATASVFNTYYATFGRTLAGATTGTYSANRAGKYIADVVNGVAINSNINTVGLVDPRRARMFRTNSLTNIVPVAGVIQGDLNVAGGGTAPNPITPMGPFVNGDLFNASIIPSTSTFPLITSIGASRNGYLMLNAESKFLQAEAKLTVNGLLPGGDAAAKLDFNAGITASFTFYSTIWDVTNQSTFISILPSAPAYITASDTKLGLGWTATPNKLEAIMTQKWLALAQISGIDSHIDQVRTGFPFLPLPIVADVSATKRPNRLIYPQSEYATNGVNTPLVSKADCLTINSKSPFYLQ
jgi:Starch-binding associating with outer membrane